MYNNNVQYVYSTLYMCVCVWVCVWALTFPPRWVTPAVGWRLLESLGCKPCSPPCRGACKGGNSLERWPWWYRGPPRGTSHAYRSQVCLPKPARDKAVSERQPPGSEILLRQFFPLHTCEGESSLTPSVCCMKACWEKVLTEIYGSHCTVGRVLLLHTPAGFRTRFNTYNSYTSVEYGDKGLKGWCSVISDFLEILWNFGQWSIINLGHCGKAWY